MVCWAVSINLNPRIGRTHSFHDAMILLCHIIELEKIEGLSRVVHRMLQVAPLAFDLDLRFIHLPTYPHWPLAAAERYPLPHRRPYDPSASSGVADPEEVPADGGDVEGALVGVPEGTVGG